MFVPVPEYLPLPMKEHEFLHESVAAYVTVPVYMSMPVSVAVPMCFCSSVPLPVYTGRDTHC